MKDSCEGSILGEMMEEKVGRGKKGFQPRETRTRVSTFTSISIAKPGNFVKLIRTLLANIS